MEFSNGTLHEILVIMSSYAYIWQVLTDSSRDSGCQKHSWEIMETEANDTVKRSLCHRRCRMQFQGTAESSHHAFPIPSLSTTYLIKLMNNEGCQKSPHTPLTRNNHRTLSELAERWDHGQPFTTLNQKQQLCRHHHANEVPG